ncbi:RNA polymerase sigma factor, sigma-70 family [Halobacillus karajensis]|uniref:RNA polymerase factor sigma-70 n=1 Tax=Halobacillus karajensis TaxID=195088 RepID=A0A059NZ40_9BACI|nr:sigma-70 family RNA polymerase sigma factor [Halobacillus karajensis]CDQ18899.1 RNA polymerase factor sigma-70 [Halobacillus karajensis]CDQ23028.1 RNA polymerase factor sigma-70 [Halobacillus karajensis]CDQ26510.1 RNA polymerase factor sigma-70 [Halobacillus karajensis]SEH44625.1 RNA polymerase sigma factor, sigma-70 family [Halobacillus karajensis]
MVTDEKFERIVEETEGLIYHHIHKLHIIDRNGDFYAEGLFALWNAYRTYNPEAGAFVTYLHWKVRNALIDKIRKDSRITMQEEGLAERMAKEGLGQWEDGITDTYMWKQVKASLTPNQWKWVYHTIIMDRSVAKTAYLEKVTHDAVKNWGRHARRKLKELAGTI